MTNAAAPAPTAREIINATATDLGWMVDDRTAYGYALYIRGEVTLMVNYNPRGAVSNAGHASFDEGKLSGGLRGDFPMVCYADTRKRQRVVAWLR